MQRFTTLCEKKTFYDKKRTVETYITVIIPLGVEAYDENNNWQ